MKTKRTPLSLLLCAALIAALLCGCGKTPSPETPPSSADTSFTVTDMEGHELTFTEPVTRVVALTASDCEIVCALGAMDTLVGRGEYCDYPAEVLSVPAVQSAEETNMEQIIALEPQVLFVTSMNQSPEQLRQLSDAGIRVVVSDANDIEGVYTAIRLIGTVLGRSEKAEALIAGMETAFDAIRESRITEDETVYFEVSPLEWGLWTAGSGTFMNEVAEMMGLRNCFADVEGWGEISEEQVLDRDPDYIVTVAMYYGEGPTPEEEIASRPGWENVTAVKNGAILDLQNNELSRPANRLADGARMLFDFVNSSKQPKA